MPDPSKYNRRIINWESTTAAQLDKQFDKYGIEHRRYSPSPHPAREILKAIHSLKNGMVSKVSFKFPRHMVFVHKGVGKGVPISIAGSSATARKPKPWFNEVIDPAVDELADIVAQETADYIVADIGIR